MRQREDQEVEAAQEAERDERCRPGAIAVEVGVPGSSDRRFFVPGAGRSEWFRDLDVGPEMVVVPAGSFVMGSAQSELGHFLNENPQHTVTFAKPFAVGRFAVTFDEWDACVADSGCNGYRRPDEGWGRGRRPAINVSWDDAIAYVAWLVEKTGKPYGLLSEAEWEYVARAGTTTRFCWGNSISTSQANYNADVFSEEGAQGEFREHTVPVDWFEPNPWGLYQVHGNVLEWTRDCYNNGYDGAPTNGTPWTSGDCSCHVVRGGCWLFGSENLRSAARVEYETDNRRDIIGFRVARTLARP